MELMVHALCLVGALHDSSVSPWIPKAEGNISRLNFIVTTWHNRAQCVLQFEFIDLLFSSMAVLFGWSVLPC